MLLPCRGGPAPTLPSSCPWTRGCHCGSNPSVPLGCGFRGGPGSCGWASPPTPTPPPPTCLARLLHCLTQHCCGLRLPFPTSRGGCLTDSSNFSVSAAGSEGQFPSFIQATVCTQQVKTTCIRRAFPPEAWPRVLTCWSSSQDLGSGVSLSDGNGFPVSAEDWDYPYLCQVVTSVPR